jgi:hypothetical protein
MGLDRLPPRSPGRSYPAASQTDLLPISQRQPARARRPTARRSETLRPIPQQQPPGLVRTAHLPGDLPQRPALGAQPMHPASQINRRMHRSQPNSPRSRQQTLVGSPRNCADPLNPLSTPWVHPRKMAQTDCVTRRPCKTRLPGCLNQLSVKSSSSTAAVTSFTCSNDGPTGAAALAGFPLRPQRGVFAGRVAMPPPGRSLGGPLGLIDSSTRPLLGEDHLQPWTVLQDAPQLR